jgi:hypothetical protein
MPYRVWATNDVLAAADVNAITADALTADVAANEQTTSTTYTDLATAGPSVTLSFVNGQGALVWIACRMSHSVGGGSAAVASFVATGAVSVAAGDANGIEINDAVAGITLSRPTWVTAGSTGSATFTMKYKVKTSGTGTFLERRIIVKKF